MKYRVENGMLKEQPKEGPSVKNNDYFLAYGPIKQYEEYLKSFTPKSYPIEGELPKDKSLLEGVDFEFQYQHKVFHEEWVKATKEQCEFINPAFKRIVAVPILKVDTEILEAVKNWCNEMGAANKQQRLGCTCRDDQKQKPLCPVCDKDEFEKMVELQKIALQPKQDSKEVVWVKLIDGFKTIEGARVTYATDEIRSDVMNMKGDFVLPSKYTFEIIPSDSFGKVAKIKTVPQEQSKEVKESEDETWKEKFKKHFKFTNTNDSRNLTLSEVMVWIEKDLLK